MIYANLRTTSRAYSFFASSTNSPLLLLLLRRPLDASPLSRLRYGNRKLLKDSDIKDPRCSRINGPLRWLNINPISLSLTRAAIRSLSPGLFGGSGVTKLFFLLGDKPCIIARLDRAFW